LVTLLEGETGIGKGGTLTAQRSRLDPIMLDKLGYLPFACSGGQLHFHRISKLCERTSVIINHQPLVSASGLPPSVIPE